MDSSLLVPFRLAVQERGLGVEGVHVHQRGQRPVEHHTTIDNRRNVHSVAKTFTAVAIGIARDEGALSLRDDPDADHQGDPLRAFFASPMLDAPGEVFRYRGTNSYVLGRIIHRHYGQDLRDFLLPRLFEPLGIANPQWHRCPLGYPLAADGLFLRTREMARLAETLLEHGVYRGRRIVSADFVGHMAGDIVIPLGHRDDPESSTGYGLHVWRCTRPGTWRMDGLYGQFGIIVPDLGACISLTGHYEGSTGDILRAVWSELLPVLATVS